MFDNLTGTDKRTAVALLNNYNRQVASWQRQADELRGVGSVNLRDYIGFTTTETNEVTSAADFRAMLEARREAIDIRVNAQRERMRIREQTSAERAQRRRVINERLTGKRQPGKRGRPKLHLLSYGQYVYFAVAFNHGQGAGFRGYDVAEPSPQVDYTRVEDWI